ncbi:conserved hypothetical protein [Flavobacterium sp. 9AF]|uniref:hypothetical protein n=1 Tax=Flavobacterium sp. 9AF TaxID=2653142 RepID=UPI0012F080D9|nr:hypothetical protein [Flavobacterium sp. 9AF]VXB36302.1 conserved hypothetical protein [Flavobacterium sp. 9AF]
MNNPKPFHKRIALVLLAIFLPSLLPVNLLYASNNGPNAFEAASFEPIDAADMVNLATGDMSYTMPLFNIPSPEGGYPLTLSYKAGIAMDQEASWVGLGWSLNPGAINRSVNGFADDVENGTNETFIFDQGGSQDYYSTGIGGNVNGITIGVGAYWGSNKTFGGSVTFGVGPAVGTLGAGTLGTNIGVGYSGSVDDFVNNISNGVSFKTLKNQGSGISSNGLGVSKGVSNISSGDYNVRVSSEQFGGFLFYYGHTKIQYSLFKQSFDSFSGTLYPYSAYNSSLPQYFKKNFDTNRLVLYNKEIDDIFNINDAVKINNYTSLLLPNFDHYTVNAQGLNGNIIASFNEETSLFSRGNEDLIQNTGNNAYNKTYYLFKNDPNLLDYSLKLNSKLFFEFNNTNSSFLRIDRTSIQRNTSIEQELSTLNAKEFFSATTNNSYIYNENLTPEGNQIKIGNRKRTGKYIESFTNSQLTSHSVSFIEAKNLDRTNIKTYEPNAIGAFRITDIDGKTYHYSLPVINFQTWYKNFGNPNNENAEFYLNESNNPYATDWLLTAVTGPDYVDINNNNIVDNEDYGYWVEFDYGKWTDGYIWQTSSGEKDLVQGDFKDNNRYEYYRGRKQVYYLDAVRTRTHTAYFIKSLRKDAQGKKVEQFTNRVTNINNFNPYTDASSYSAFYDIAGGSWAYPNIPVIGSMYNMPTGTYNGHPIKRIAGYKKNFIYSDFPANYSLKLDKVILLKNTNNIAINKANGSNLLQNKKAYYSKNRVFEVTNALFEFGQDTYDFTTEMNGNWSLPLSPLQEIDIHNNANIIDQNDLAGLNINDKAEKIINFNYDLNYPLMPNSPTSIANGKGKLTLNSIEYLGKKGVSYMPKYQFYYKNPSTPFEIDKEDAWGYHKDDASSWSLREIITPTGGHLRFDYESDDYNAVASLSSRVFSKGLSFYLYKDNNTNELYFRVTRNTDEAALENFTSFLDYFSFEEKVTLDLFICRRSKYGGHYRQTELNIDGKKGQVSNVDANSVTFVISNTLANWYSDNQSEGWLLNRNFSNTSVRFDDGSFDGIIMRNPGYKNCPEWRDLGLFETYENDDLNFHYKLASSNTPNKGKGGGLRVKSISVIQNGQIESIQKYFYNKPDFDKEVSSFNYKSSGSTSFVPYKEPVVLPYASELPPPIVLYKNVSVENYGKNTNELLAKTDYSFETLQGYHTQNNYLYSLGDKLTIEQTQNEYPILNKLKFSKFEIKNRYNDLGRLLTIKQYNSKGQLTNSQKINYKTNLDNEGETGVKQESFINRSNLKTSPIREITATSKISYPSKVESINYTSNNSTSTVNYDKYDFLTGEPLETVTTDSYGKKVKLKTIPAYKKYPGMSSKVDDINNANMLSQTAVTYSYIIDNNNQELKTGVGITTWNNEWIYQDVVGNNSNPNEEIAKEKIWRKHKSYTWNGLTDSNGIFTNYDSQNGDDGFVWGVGLPQTNTRWKQISEVTLYNHYSMPLESKDINGNKATTKMDVDNTKVIITGNAAYNEMYYSGAETSFKNQGYWIGQEVRNSNGTITDEKAHTGKYSVAATDATQFGVLMRNGHRPGKYKISVWVHKDNYQKARLRWFNNDTENTFESNEKYFAGDWVLLNYYTDVHYMNNTVAYWYVNSIDNTTVYFDDLMIRPIASSITGCVYNEYDELTYIVGNNGLATRFEYDAAGRLIKTYTEVLDDSANGITGGFKLSAKNKINYKYMN